MRPFDALLVGHTYNPFNQSITSISSVTSFGRLSALRKGEAVECEALGGALAQMVSQPISGILHYV